MKDIPEQLIINWDQTGLSIVPTGNWTMEKEGTQIVLIAHSNDKRQLTAVLAIMASRDYLSPQLSGKDTQFAIHRFHFHQVGICGTRRTTGQTRLL